MYLHSLNPLSTFSNFIRCACQVIFSFWEKKNKMFNVALQEQHYAGLSQNRCFWKPGMGLLSAGCGLPVKGISSTRWEINLPLPLEAVVEFWGPHLRNVLTSRGHTRKTEGEEWRGYSQKWPRCWKISFMMWVVGRPVINLIQEKRSRGNVIAV